MGKIRKKYTLKWHLFFLQKMVVKPQGCCYLMRLTHEQERGEYYHNLLHKSNTQNKQTTVLSASESIRRQWKWINKKWNKGGERLTTVRESKPVIHTHTLTHILATKCLLRVFVTLTTRIVKNPHLSTPGHLLTAVEMQKYTRVVSAASFHALINRHLSVWLWATVARKNMSVIK